MSREHYRTPSPAPPSDRKVVSRAETPEESEARERRERTEHQRIKYSGQTAAALAELEAARRSYGMRMRGIGLLFTIVAVGMTAHQVHRILGGADSLAVFRLGAMPMLLGPFGLAFGAGGAADPASVPGWWKVGGLVALLASLGLSEAVQIELPLMIAGWLAG